MKIGILGTGYLGKRLALKLNQQSQYEVICTTRQSSLPDELNHIKIDIDHSSPDELKDFFNQLDTLVICLPPSSSPNYENLAHLIKSHLSRENCHPLFPILISSIGVFAPEQGNVDETSLPQGKLSLVNIESNFQSLFPNTTILRLGGIVGEKREPWKFMEGKKKDFDEYLHLVHINDCVMSIEKVLEKNIQGETFNIINNQRVLKSQFYTSKCQQTPFFGSLLKNAKNISNTKSREQLNLSYQDV